MICLHTFFQKIVYKEYEDWCSPNIDWNLKNPMALNCYITECLMIMCCVCFSEGHGKLTVFAMKAMLATMCGGKILDKLRCEYHAFYTAIQQ